MVEMIEIAPPGATEATTVLELPRRQLLRSPVLPASRSTLWKRNRVFRMNRQQLTCHRFRSSAVQARSARVPTAPREPTAKCAFLAEPNKPTWFFRRRPTQKKVIPWLLGSLSDTASMILYDSDQHYKIISEIATAPNLVQRSRKTRAVFPGVRVMTLRHCITRLTFSSNVSPAARRFSAEPSRSSARCTEYLRMINESTATASTIDCNVVSVQSGNRRRKGTREVGARVREGRTSTESSTRARSMTSREPKKGISRPFVTRLLDVDESLRFEVVAIRSPVLCCYPRNVSVQNAREQGRRTRTISVESDSVEKDLSPFRNEDALRWRAIFQWRGRDDSVDDGEFRNYNHGGVKT